MSADPRRSSRRLSGIRPDLSVTQAAAAIARTHSPRRPTKRKEPEDQEQQPEQEQKKIKLAEDTLREEKEEPEETSVVTELKTPAVTEDTLQEEKEKSEESTSAVTELKTPASDNRLPQDKENTSPPSSALVVKMPKSKKSIAVQIKGAAPPKGKCRSGRFWKSDRNRFKSVIKVKGTQVKYEQRLKAKLEMKKVKEFETMLKDKAKEEKEALRQRQIDNKKRREENERKSEIVQVIKNPAKIKRMKKKQLRLISKRDTLGK